MAKKPGTESHRAQGRPEYPKVSKDDTKPPSRLEQADTQVINTLTHPGPWPPDSHKPGRNGQKVAGRKGPTVKREKRRSLSILAILTRKSIIVGCASVFWPKV